MLRLRQVPTTSSASAVAAQHVPSSRSLVIQWGTSHRALDTSGGDTNNASVLDAGKEMASSQLALPDYAVRQLHEMLPLNLGLEFCNSTANAEETAPVQQHPAPRSHQKPPRMGRQHQSNHHHQQQQCAAHNQQQATPIQVMHPPGLPTMVSSPPHMSPMTQQMNVLSPKHMNVASPQQMNVASPQQMNVMSPQQMSPANAVQMPCSPIQTAPNSQPMASPVAGDPASRYFSPPLPALLPPWRYQVPQYAHPQPTPNRCYNQLQQQQQKPPGQRPTYPQQPAYNPPSYPSQAQQYHYPQDWRQHQSRKRKQQAKPNKLLKKRKLTKQEDHLQPPPPSYQQHLQLYHGQPMDHPIQHQKALLQQQCHFSHTLQQQELNPQEINPRDIISRSSIKKDQSNANQQQPTPPSNLISYKSNITFAPMALVQEAKAVLPPHSNILDKLKQLSSL
ncbi:Hypothetical predicted protein [Cloeon dipterum]|nr:Hypothetical predicted protein [Cloeon dipterum]